MIVVNISDLKISNNPSDVIITYALGSCVGITLYDPINNIGGMLHSMLPEAREHQDKARENPFMFVDTGFKIFLDKMLSLGSDKKKLIVCACGGGSPTARNKEDFFEIGLRNVTVLKKVLWQNGLFLKGSDFGGYDARTMILELSNGRVSMKVNLTQKNLFDGIIKIEEKIS